MKAWIGAQRHWLRVEQLPGYAYDINPIEQVWGNVKGTELANLCPDTIDEAHAAAQAGLERVGTSYHLLLRLPRPLRSLSMTKDHSISERPLRPHLWCRDWMTAARAALTLR